jgi:hypothetical protein
MKAIVLWKKEIKRTMEINQNEVNMLIAMLIGCSMGLTIFFGFKKYPEEKNRDVK